MVADVGCGVGYFSLKLAPKVAEHGSVLAEDILGESLTFLWIRARLHHQSNIRVLHGNPDDPHLPKGGVDAVLIANSYHEFTKPLAILDHTFRALRSDGRLVVLDRGPRSYHRESREIQMQQYLHRRFNQRICVLRTSGLESFEITSRVVSGAVFPTSKQECGST